MTTHSSILAWRIPWTEEPGRVHGVSKNQPQLKWCSTLTPGIYWQDLNIQLRPTSPLCSWFIYPPAVDFPFESLTRHLKFGSTYTKLNSWSSHNQIYSFNRFPYVVVQSLSHVWHIVIPGTAACQVSLSFTISQSLLKLMSLESVMPSNHLILGGPLLLLPSVLPSIPVFLMSLPFTSCGKSIGVSYSVPVLPIQGWFPFIFTGLISLISLMYEGFSRVFSNITVWKQQFFRVQSPLSRAYVTTGKTIDLTIWTLLAKWCLCFWIHYLLLWWLFFPGSNVFSYHGCHHYLQWFSSPRKGNLTP